MGAWIGLVGVVAGALVAFIGQYLVRNSEANERREAHLLEQLAIIQALSEDYRNRVWEERQKIAVGVVAAWDLGAYRLAQAHLKILCRDGDVLANLVALQKTGIELGRSWRLAPEDEVRTEEAWKAHRQALDRFIASSARMFGRGWSPVTK